MSAILPIRSVEKVWGRETLPPPFAAPAGKRIGEIWFEPPEALDQLLVKYLFTSEKLSVQVHPGDAQAQALGDGARGKEECWLVIDAAPGATLGIGFDRAISGDELRAAALDGSIEELMIWHEVAVGDFFYIPAGTVHAIGPGVSLIEIQQNCDITYRLYDYGRPRELHLDRGVAVARGEPYGAQHRRQVAARGDVTLTDGPHFRLVRTDGPADDPAVFGDAALLVIPLDAAVTIAGERVEPGQCALADNLSVVDFPAEGRVLLAQPC